MKHISEIPLQSSPPPSESKRPIGSDLERRAADFFVHMTRLFGGAWTARYGETDDGLWASVLSRLDEREVKHGLRHMLSDWTDSFPPTPAQFRSVARIPLAHRIVPPSHRLSAPQPSDPATTDAALRALRALVGAR